jgi:hypothetical protein
VLDRHPSFLPSFLPLLFILVDPPYVIKLALDLVPPFRLEFIGQTTSITRKLVIPPATTELTRSGLKTVEKAGN